MHYPIIATRSFPSISNDWSTTKSIILLFCGNFRKQGLHPSRRLAAVFRYTRRTGCGSVCMWSDTGVHEQHYINYVMTYAACVGRHKHKCMEESRIINSATVEKSVLTLYGAVFALRILY